MENNSNTGKSDKQIGSSSNLENSPTATTPSGVVGQENAPAQAVINVDEVMPVRELRDWFPSMRLPRGYGKGKRKIDSVYRTCSSDFNPSTRTRRRLVDGSILEVERRPQSSRILTISEFRSEADQMTLGGSPGVLTIWPSFQNQHLFGPRVPAHMPTIYEDSDQDTDSSTPPTCSSNDEMIDADSDTMSESH